MQEVAVIKSKKRRRTISLQISENGRIILRSPYHLSEQRIKEFLHSKRHWLKAKLHEIECLSPQIKPKTFCEGEEFAYLGQNYKLRLTENIGRTDLFFSGKEFILGKECKDQTKKQLIDWYKKEASLKLKERIEHYSPQLEAYPRCINITCAKSRWGSCTPTDALNFPWRIAMLPLSLIDYIVVHELAHIKEKNHSARFWRLVSSIIPGYKEQEKWLKQNSRFFYL